MNSYFANQLSTKSVKPKLKPKLKPTIIHGPYIMFGSGRIIESIVTKPKIISRTFSMLDRSSRYNHFSFCGK